MSAEEILTDPRCWFPPNATSHVVMCPQRVATREYRANAEGTHASLQSSDCEDAYVTRGGLTTLTGVSATILEYNPYYSGNNNTGTNATVLLVKRNPTQWAQFGWFKSKIQNGSVQRQVGLEFYVSASNNQYVFWPGRTVGSANGYKILFNESTSVYSFYLNSSFLTTMNPLLEPSEYQLFTETHDYGDQMPGGINSHEKFTYARYYTGSGHTSHTMTDAIHNPYSSAFGASSDGLGRYDMWDKKCNG